MHAVRVLSILFVIVSLLPWGAVLATRAAAMPVAAFAQTPIAEDIDRLHAAVRADDSAVVAPQGKKCRIAIPGTSCDPVSGLGQGPSTAVKTLSAGPRWPAPQMAVPAAFPPGIFHPPQSA